MTPQYEGLFQYVVPYGTQEASLYGEGDAVFRGDRLSGTARFVNTARRRGDGVNLPSARGIIRTDDGCHVLFTLEGRTPAPREGKRRVMCSLFFESDAEQYRWLNSVVCVLEGELQSGGLTSTRIYLCVDEFE